MKALFYPSFGQLEINDQPLPTLKRNEVLLKVYACGICGSELETFGQRSERRMPPLIMGHEFCGVIQDKGTEVTDFSAGTYVVSNSIISCGDCSRCQAGETNLCVNRQVFGMQRNGAFAEFVNVPAFCLIEVPRSVSPREACQAEPLANGVHMVRLTEHLELKSILIIGAGPIGLMTQQAFQILRGVSTIVMDLKDERLAVAGRLGAALVINPGKTDAVKILQELTEEIDLVVDAVGTTETQSLALKSVRPGGTCILVGLHENSNAFSSYDIILQEKKVLGSYAATQEDMEHALQLIASGKADVSSWVHYHPLEEGRLAFDNMLQGKEYHIKSVLLVDDAK